MLLSSAKETTMFHRIKNVKVLKDFKLQVEFQEGCSKLYDAKPLIDTIPAFSVFKERPYIFEDAEVDEGGYGIIWNDDLDLSSEELWNNGKSI